jgi:copper homeostasis protein
MFADLAAGSTPHTVGGRVLKRDIVFEVCAEDLEACEAAFRGGANRIELCSALSEGGLTPSHALIQAAVTQCALPIYTMLRPRGGDFVYSDAEFALMQQDLDHARDLGVSGFVAGILRPDGTVDGSRMERLVKQAAPFEVTFHRAFDMTANLEHALEDVISTGCRRLLTSGGAPDVYAGAQTIRLLEEQADGRIAIAAGGGLRLETALEVARITAVSQFHGSVRHWQFTSEMAPGHAIMKRLVTNPEDVRTMISALRMGQVLKTDEVDELK